MYGQVDWCGNVMCLFMLYDVVVEVIDFVGFVVCYVLGGGRELCGYGFDDFVDGYIYIFGQGYVFGGGYGFVFVDQMIYYFWYVYVFDQFVVWQLGDGGKCVVGVVDDEF